MIETLRLMANDFQSATYLCRRLRRQLVCESEAARSGWEISDFFGKKADDLGDLVEGLWLDKDNFPL